MFTIGLLMKAPPGQLLLPLSGARIAPSSSAESTHVLVKLYLILSGRHFPRAMPRRVPCASQGTQVLDATFECPHMWRCDARRQLHWAWPPLDQKPFYDARSAHLCLAKSQTVFLPASCAYRPSSTGTMSVLMSALAPSLRTGLSVLHRPVWRP
jgi:hypothetical protein